jgi:hypothetical protein
MQRTIRLIRGMIGTGLLFAFGVGVVTSIIGGIFWLLPGGLTTHALIWIVARFTFIAFPVGAIFSGVFALTFRGRSFDKISLQRFAELGAGAGLVIFLLMSINAAAVWSLNAAIANLVILTLLGAGAATGTLLLARRGRPALPAGDELPSLLDDGHTSA